MKKPIIPIFLVALCALSLSACALLDQAPDSDPYGLYDSGDPSSNLANSQPTDASADTSTTRDPATVGQAQDFHWAKAQGEIAVGMAMSDVRSAWGDPEKIDTAGDPAYGNQRWTYFDGLSSPWALRSGKRIVYFERNRVVGWNTSH